MFFGYNEYHSVTAVMIDLNLPGFITIMHNVRYTYNKHWWSSNALTVNFRNIGIALCLYSRLFIVCTAFVRCALCVSVCVLIFLYILLLYL